MSYRFDELFDDHSYLELKNSLFTYLLRKRLVQRVWKGESEGLLLDLGTGISPVASANAATVYADVSLVAMQQLRLQAPASHYVALNATGLPFRDESFSSLICSEVLEHIAEDERALCEMQRVLRPGGRLILTVPVNPYLYTFDDRYVGHYRRYRLPELQDQLERIGFTSIRAMKAAGLLEKAAMYSMVRLFSFLRSRNQNLSSKRWWLSPYRPFNYVWSYLAAWQARISPWSLTTIALIDCRKKEAT